MAISPYCPTYAPFFGFLGAALALVFGNMGAAYGTWKSALGLATIATSCRATRSKQNL